MSEFALSFANLSVTLGGACALNEVSGEFRAGRVTAVIGPNGAGKSTLLDVLTGFRKPVSGDWRLDGQALTGLTAHQIARRGVRRTFQKVRTLVGVTATECVSFHLRPSRHEFLDALLRRGRIRTRSGGERAQALAALETVGLAEHREALPEQLSYGQRKLLALACLYVSAPRVALLDEPVSGLSPFSRNRALGAIRLLADAGTAVVFVEHILSAVRQVADEVIVLDRGVIVPSGDGDPFAEQVMPIHDNRFVE